MKKLLSALLLLIAGNAQAQDLAWAKGLFGDPFPGITSIATDGQGNAYIAGSYTTPIDVDPGAGVVNLSVAMGTDAYILKLDAAGSFVWVKELKVATSGDYIDCRDIAIDGAGNIYVAGSYNGTADFDPGAGTSNLTGTTTEAFLLKLDNTGSFVYAHKMGGPGTDNAMGVCIDAQGNVMVTGTFEAVADFDPTSVTFNLSSNGLADVFVARYDNQGNFMWAAGRGSAAGETTRSIAADAAGGIFGTSSSQDTLTVFRLDGAGAFTWEKQVWGTPGQWHNARLALDPNGGDIYLAGSFNGTLDFDPGTGTHTLTANSSDMFVLKLNNNGDFDWARMIDASGIVTNANVIVYDQNNVYVAGNYSGTADLNPGAGVYNVMAIGGAPDIFVARLNSSGNFVSGGSVGGKIDDAVQDIAISSSGELHLTGVFRDTADFDPGTGTSTMISPAGYSVFVMKLNAPTGIDILDNAAIEVCAVPNPVTSLLTITSNTKINSISIIDITGREVLRSTEMTIDMSGLVSGVYFVRVRDVYGGVKTEKIIKQ